MLDVAAGDRYVVDDVFDLAGESRRRHHGERHGVAATSSANPAEKRYFLIEASQFYPGSAQSILFRSGQRIPCQRLCGETMSLDVLVSVSRWLLVDEPKSPSVRNDRLKPMLCVTSLRIRSRVCE